MGSFSIWHWLIVLLVVVLLFGTKKLRNVGSDMGSAVKSFRKGMADDDDESAKIEDGAKAGSDSKVDRDREKQPRS